MVQRIALSQHATDTRGRRQHGRDAPAFAHEAATADGLPPSHERVRHLNMDDDDAYVSSYSHFSIHEEMLQVCV